MTGLSASGELKGSAICPICGQSDRVEKVSTIYMDALGAGRLPLAVKQVEKVETPSGRLTSIPEKELRLLVKKLAPPSSVRRPFTRLIHPDQMILSFSLILIIFIAGMLRSQPGMLFQAIAILVAFYLLYLYLRPRILNRFEREVRLFIENNQRVEAAIKDWMKLFYCGRDDGVFIPGEDELIPIDEMQAYLLRTAKPAPASTESIERK